MAILYIEWVPVEGHGAGDGRLDQAPEVNPDCLIVHYNIDHLVMEWRSMVTFRQFLVRYEHFRDPDMLQQVGIHIEYRGYVWVCGGKHCCAGAISSVQLETVVHPGKL